MNIKRILAFTCLTLVFAAPLRAGQNWAEDFLLKYKPSTADSPTAVASTTPLVPRLQAGTLPLMMQDVVNLMLEYNLDIQSNRFGPRSSYLQSLVFYRTLQPSIRFAGTMTRDTSASTSQLNGAASLSQLRHNYAVGFAQALKQGTSVAVDLTMVRSSSNSSNATYNPSYTGNLRYSIGQHLLRDRGSLVNLRQIRIAQNNQKISETQFEIQIINLLAEAQRAYWDLVFAGEDLKVKQRSLDLAERTLNENQMKVEIGTMAPIDVVQTRSEVADRREQLITATFSITQTEDQIKTLISADKDPSLFLLKLTALELPREPSVVGIPDLTEAVHTALENRPEMRQSGLDLENKEIDVRYTRNQKLPIFDVTASYSQNGTGGRRTDRGNVIGGEIRNVIPGGISDAFGQLFSYDYSGYSVGFSLTIPLSNKAADADHERALTEKRLSESRQASIVQQIALEVRNALTQVEMNRARIQTAQLSRQLAQQRLEAEQTKLNLGTSTLRFVLEEQRNVAQAETNELQNLVNFTKSLVALDQAMGMTLRRNNVEIDKALAPGPVASAAPAYRSANE